MISKRIEYFPLLIFFTIVLLSCKSGVKQKNEQLYSRHLQRQVPLTVITTPPPDKLSDLNLLILNDGQDLEQMRMKSIVDSLYKLDKIGPLLIIGVHAGDRLQEFGVSDFPDYLKRGAKAGYYASFIENELLPHVKKQAGTRSFKTVAIAGWSLGGLSAMDIAWDQGDKFDKLGVFSGSFWWRDKDAADSSYTDSKNRIMLSKIKSSRKEPKLTCWFYAGEKEEEGDRDKDGVIDVLDDMQDLVALLKIKKSMLNQTVTIVTDPSGQHNQASWSRQMPAFLQWAFGKK